MWQLRSGGTADGQHYCVDRIEICSMEDYVWKDSDVFWLPGLWTRLSQSWVQRNHLLEHRWCLTTWPTQTKEVPGIQRWKWCWLCIISPYTWRWKILSWAVSTPPPLSLQCWRHNSMATYWTWGLTATQQNRKRHIRHELTWCEKQSQEKVQGVRRQGDASCREGVWPAERRVLGRSTPLFISGPPFTEAHRQSVPSGSLQLRGRELAAVRSSKCSNTSIRVKFFSKSHHSDGQVHLTFRPGCCQQHLKETLVAGHGNMVLLSIWELLLGSRFPGFGSKHSSGDIHLSQSMPTALPATACLCFPRRINLQPHLQDVMETSITRCRCIDKGPLLLRLHPLPPGNLHKTQTEVGWRL